MKLVSSDRLHPYDVGWLMPPMMGCHGVSDMPHDEGHHIGFCLLKILGINVILGGWGGL